MYPLVPSLVMFPYLPPFLPRAHLSQLLYIHRLSNQSGTMTTSLTHRGQLPIPKTGFDSQSGMSAINTLHLHA